MATIEDLTDEDAEEAAEATRDCMRDAWERWEKDYYPNEAMEFDLTPHSAEEYRKRIALPDAFIIVAKERGRIVGVCSGRVVGKGGVASLDWLGIAPESRKQGIGNQLLEAVEEHVKDSGCHKISLVTLPCLTDAVRLFFKRGWVPECNLTRHSWKVDFMVVSKWFD